MIDFLNRVDLKELPLWREEASRKALMTGTQITDECAISGTRNMSASTNRPALR
jgi:hypothetical protein